MSNAGGGPNSTKVRRIEQSYVKLLHCPAFDIWRFRRNPFLLVRQVALVTRSPVSAEFLNSVVRLRLACFDCKSTPVNRCIIIRPMFGSVLFFMHMISTSWSHFIASWRSPTCQYDWSYCDFYRCRSIGTFLYSHTEEQGRNRKKVTPQASPDCRLP